MKTNQKKFVPPINDKQLKDIHTTMSQDLLSFRRSCDLHGIDWKILERIVDTPTNEEEIAFANKLLKIKAGAEALMEKNLVSNWQHKGKLQAGDFLKSTLPRYNVKTKMVVDVMFERVDKWVRENCTEEQYRSFLSYLAIINE